MTLICNWKTTTTNIFILLILELATALFSWTSLQNSYVAQNIMLLSWVWMLSSKIMSQAQNVPDKTWQHSDLTTVLLWHHNYNVSTEKLINKTLGVPSSTEGLNNLLQRLWAGGGKQNFWKEWKKWLGAWFDGVVYVTENRLSILPIKITQDPWKIVQDHVMIIQDLPWSRNDHKASYKNRKLPRSC